MILTLLMWVSLAVLAVLLYSDGWNDDQTDEVRTVAKSLATLVVPQYGGIPVELNQRLAAAQESGDTATEAEIHTLRQKLFRNRRTPSQQSAADIEGRRKFIAKYGTAGELALKHDDMQRKLASLSIAEQKVLIDAQIAEAAPPVVKKKAGGKK